MCHSFIIRKRQALFGTPSLTAACTYCLADRLLLLKCLRLRYVRINASDVLISQDSMSSAEGGESLRRHASTNFIRAMCKPILHELSSEFVANVANTTPIPCRRSNSMCA